MELSQTVVESLTIAGDSAHIPDKCYRSLLDKVFDGVLDAQNRDPITGSKEFDSVDKAVLKEAYAGLVSCVTEAVKHDSEAATLESVLEDCKFSTERIKTFLSIYQERKQLLQILLGSIGVTPPHIVDVEWRLDYCIKNNHLEKVNQPVYLINLKTEVPGEEVTKDLQFSCSQEQLQDLVGKLKDATKCLEKISQA